MTQSISELLLEAVVAVHGIDGGGLEDEAQYASARARLVDAVRGTGASAAVSDAAVAALTRLLEVQWRGCRQPGAGQHVGRRAGPPAAGAPPPCADARNAAPHARRRRALIAPCLALCCVRIRCMLPQSAHCRAARCAPPPPSPAASWRRRETGACARCSWWQR